MLKDILIAEDHSLVASNGYVSDERGIKPVITKIHEDRYYFKDLEVADKVIGKASAMLLVYSGVRKVYAHLLSLAGKQILEKYQIEYEYGKLTDHIVNRTKDGMCPMEMTVRDIDDLQEAYEALCRKIGLQ